jgi:hypothetical protein
MIWPLTPCFEGTWTQLPGEPGAPWVDRLPGSRSVTPVERRHPPEPAGGASRSSRSCVDKAGDEAGHKAVDKAGDKAEDRTSRFRQAHRGFKRWGSIRRRPGAVMTSVGESAVLAS